MITYEEAYQKVINSSKPIGKEKIHFLQSLDRVLSQDIFSDINIPPFNKSAMDGYACRKEDLNNELELIEIIPAGVFPKKTIGKNQCSKIMTGAPVPKGADIVVMVEYSHVLENKKVVFTNPGSKPNICLEAEDVKKGDIVLEKGTLIKAKHIPILASVGAVNIEVYKRPKIAIISTGEELVEPEITPKASQIRNSNAYQLIASAMEMNIEYEYIGIADDTKESINKNLNLAIENADIILCSGAVSMGDFDFVPLVLKEAHIDIHFHGIKVKPGKKTIFGTSSKKWFFGVPGNPVSAFFQFETLVKPLILSIMNNCINIKPIKYQLGEDFCRKNAKRKAFEPIRIDSEGNVRSIKYNGSAHIHALSDADGIIAFEIGTKELKKGDIVDVRPL